MNKNIIEMTKDPFINAYAHDDNIVKINECSTITVQEANEIICANFLPKYSIINVEIETSPNEIIDETEKFIKYMKNKTTMVLIQQYGLNKATISIVYNRNKSTIEIMRDISYYKSKSRYIKIRR